MKVLREVLCILLVVLCASTLHTAAEELVSLGLLVSGPTGDYLFSFPDNEEYMFVRFGGDQASFQIHTDTALYQDIAGIIASGIFEGYQTTGVGLLDRGIMFGQPGSFGHVFVADSSLATLTFTTDGGAVSERFEIPDEGVDDGYAYVHFNFDDIPGEIWIEVLNGQLIAPPEEPEISLISFGLPAGGGGAFGVTPESISITMKNKSETPFSGPIDCAIGLSYATNWIPEWCTTYSKTRGFVTLGPGEEATYVVEIPVAPISAVEALRMREIYWSSCYVDPDPGQDYIGILVTVNDSQRCIFVPFQDQTYTAATKKPNGNGE